MFGPEFCLGWTVHLCCLWGRLLLTWPRASESGVYRRALRVVFFIPALVFTTLWFPVFVPDFGCAWVVGTTAGQPTVLARAKAGHNVGNMP